jgi:hypothetical protein
MIRVTRDSDLPILIKDQDTSGADPRPSYLDDVKVKLEQLSSGNDVNARYAISFSQRLSPENGLEGGNGGRGDSR